MDQSTKIYRAVPNSTEKTITGLNVQVTFRTLKKWRVRVRIHFMVESDLEAELDLGS